MGDYPQRGEIWLASFPDEERERPCLVISVNRRNEYANSVLVIPITTNLRPAPTHVLLQRGEGGLSQDSVARCENITVLPKEVLGEASLGRVISHQRIREIEIALSRAVGLSTFDS